MKSTLRFFTILLFYSASVFSQTIPELQKVKSPEAAAIQKAIDIPVSMYSGIAGLNIPLYEINVNGANAPITLTYTGGGGIKVDEEATMVGLGWKLNYGGSISRTVKGKHDEAFFLEKESLADFFSLPSYEEDNSQEDAIWFMRDAKRPAGIYDLMADEFHYSADSYSGKFMYKQSESKFIIFPKEDIQIDYVKNNNRINQWEITLPDGNKHFFGEDNISSSLAAYSPPADSGIINYKVDNMWGIKKIKTIYGDSINYNYDFHMYTFLPRSTNESSSETAGGGIVPTTRLPYLIEEPIINSISFRGGNVNFITSNRVDAGTKKVDEIVVTSSSGEIIKKIKFYYSYFNGNFGIVGANYRLNVSDDYENKRLRLDSISFTGGDNVNVEKYRFTYYDNNGQLPSKYSFAQDLWGYFNGRNNSTFVPKLVYWVSNGADRKVNNNVNNVFMLKSITYPTGGKSEFTYEGNVVRRGPFSEFNSMLNDDPYTNQSVTLMLGEVSPVVMGNEKHYFKNFTVPENGGYPHPQGWSCAFGANLSNLTVSPDCSFNYAWFKIEKLNSSTGNYEYVYSYKYCYNSSLPVNSKEMLWLYPGSYRLVIITMFPTLSNNTTLLNGLSVTMRWKNSYINDNPNLDAPMNVGGLRIQEIRNYSSDGILETKKQYQYVDENGVSTGFMYEEPRHIQVFYLTNTNPTGTPPIANSGPNLTVYGSPLMPLKPISGSYVGYQQVIEKLIDTKNLNNLPLKTRYTFTYKSPLYTSYVTPYIYLDGLIEHDEWQFGKPKKIDFYKGNDSTPIKTEEYSYVNNLNVVPGADFVDEILVDHISWRSLSFPGNNSSDFTDNYLLEGHYGHLPAANLIFTRKFIYGVKTWIPSDVPLPDMAPGDPYWFDNLTLPYIKHYTSSDRLISKTTTTKDDFGTTLVQTETYNYSSTAHNQITSIETTNSLGQPQTQRFYYPRDFLSTPIYNQMNQKHMVNQIVRQENLVNNAISSTMKTNYLNWGNFIAPNTVELQKGSQTPEIRFTYNGYDTYGNFVSANQSTGSVTCYIYSYNNKYPVAEIRNASYSTIVSVLGGASAVQNFSNSIPTDSQIISFLNPLRSSSLLTNASITTYTFKPLVGVTSITDAKGYTVYYEYDSFGRLKSVKDKDHLNPQSNFNILSENFYNYRP